ncbi:MAG: hypothetical protein MUF11_10110 [Beijerinckiaceae bacterium]|nr:hypothetical protein [Beijerinckiaceae bacterium]
MPGQAAKDEFYGRTSRKIHQQIATFTLALPQRNLTHEDRDDGVDTQPPFSPNPDFDVLDQRFLHRIGGAQLDE